MRRRFEKRVYIALPEPPARTKMFKVINLYYYLPHNYIYITLITLYISVHM